jgi:hypothetical protein
VTYATIALVENSVSVNQEEYFVNLYEQLLTVRERLEGVGAHDDSMDLVEMLLKRAEPAKNDRTSTTQIQVLRHMLRMREVSDNYNIYNDLQILVSERDDAEVAAREDSAPAAYEDTEHRPKPKSFYKERKAQQEKTKKKG